MNFISLKNDYAFKELFTHENATVCKNWESWIWRWILNWRKTNMCTTWGKRKE